jgi:hypothetical protein
LNDTVGQRNIGMKEEQHVTCRSPGTRIHLDRSPPSSGEHLDPTMATGDRRRSVDAPAVDDNDFAESANYDELFKSVANPAFFVHYRDNDRDATGRGLTRFHRTAS